MFFLVRICHSGESTRSIILIHHTNRDRRCCITGREVFGNNFTGFEAAHIFPSGQTNEWNRRDMQRFIADPLVPENDKTNSIQQGFLCLATERRLFDDYQIGVNPDDEYRIAILMPRRTGDNFMLLTSKNISVPPMTYCVITIVNAYSLA
ncbi:hypothetical protein BGY98DRAFT_475031 [Russula aff. rugulosa BPL654]|nr:hypothetical protein BGY98DRAFT_475031 [Russula aff. rugulosa BPL654]